MRVPRRGEVSTGSPNPFVGRIGGAAFARHRPNYPPELAQWLAAQCAQRRHAVDLGCGSGQMAGLLAQEFERVTALDSSAAQIAAARPAERVSFRTATAEATGLADGTADLAVAAQAAHWFDPGRFHSEMRRIAAPRAVLALITYGVPQLEGSAADRFRDFFWSDIHAWWPAARVHVERGYRDLDFPFEEFAMPRFEIERAWDRNDLTDYVSTWSAVRAATEAGKAGIVESFEQDLAALWPEASQRHPITWPIGGRVGRIR